jgi:L-asparaginase
MSGRGGGGTQASSVVVVTTGGTIASRRDAATGKVIPLAGAEELAASLAWPDRPSIELDDALRVSGWDLHGAVALTLVRRVLSHLERDEVAGVVVTQGTDTIEETSYLIDRLVPSGKAVVVTGAQRATDEPDSDGPRNIRDAICVAADPAAGGCGALASFAGRIHAARDVQKVHTSAADPFESPGYGAIGEVDVGVVRIRRRPQRRPPFPHTPDALDARVDLIRLYAGSDDRLIRAAVDAGAAAIVLEGTGRGNANDVVARSVADAVRAGVLVAVCSRCLAGRVEPIYGRGGGRDLADAGAIFAGDLAGPKARVLLQLALSLGVDARAELLAEADV